MSGWMFLNKFPTLTCLATMFFLLFFFLNRRQPAHSVVNTALNKSKEQRKEGRKGGACTAHSCITHVILHLVLQRSGGAELADLLDGSRGVVVVLPQPEVVAVGRPHHVGPVQQVSI